MAVIHGASERVGDAGPNAAGIFLAVADARCNRVGGLEADADDVARQLVGVGLDGGDCLVAVGLEDPDRARRAHAVRVQPDDDLADGTLVAPAPDDLGLADWADACHFAKPFWLFLDNAADG